MSYKWTGINLPWQLLGGQSEGVVNGLTRTMSTMTSAIKTVNDIQRMINRYLSIVDSFIDKGTNIMKSAIDTAKDESQKVIDDLRGTGVYFIDLNTSVPPMWAGAFQASIQEVESRWKIRGIQKDLDTAQSATVVDNKLIKTLQNKIKIENAKIANANRFSGGNSSYYRTFVNSLEDIEDKNRPNLTESQSVNALFVLYGASNLSEFAFIVDKATQLIKSNVNILTNPPSIIPYLKNLKVRYNTSEEANDEYLIFRNYFDQSDLKFNKDNPNNSINDNIFTIVWSKKTGSGEDRKEQVEYVKFDITKTTAAIKNTSTPESIVKDLPIYTHPKGSSSDFYNFKLIVNKKRFDLSTLSQETSPERFFIQNGTLYWSNGSADFSTQNLFYRSNIYDEEKLSTSYATKNRTYLYWDYAPATSAVLGRCFQKLKFDEDYIAMYKYEIRKTNPHKNLRTSLATTGETGKDKQLKIEVCNAFDGTRKFFTSGMMNDGSDMVSTKEAADKGIIGYEYAVGLCGLLYEPLDEKFVTKSAASEIKNTYKTLPANFYSTYLIPSAYYCPLEYTTPDLKQSDTSTTDKGMFVSNADKTSMDTDIKNANSLYNGILAIVKKHLDKKITDLQTELANKKATKSDNETKLATSKSNVSTYESNIEYSSGRISTVQKEIHEVAKNPDSTTADVDSRMDNMEDNYRLLKENLAKIEYENKQQDYLKQSISKLDASIKSTEEDIVAAQTLVLDFTNKYPAKIGLIKPIKSNIQKISIIDYTKEQGISNPPDWQKLQFFTDIMAPLTTMLDAMYLFLDNVAQSAMDAASRSKELKKAFDAEINGVIKKITEAIQFIQDLLDKISKLSFSAWYLLVRVKGKSSLIGALGSSFTGGLQDVHVMSEKAFIPIAQKGCPPFGSKDFVSGFVAIGAYPGTFDDIIENLIDVSQKPIQTPPAEIEDNIDQAAVLNKPLNSPIPILPAPVPNSRIEEIAYLLAYAADALSALDANNLSRLAADLSKIFPIYDPIISALFEKVGNDLNIDTYTDAGYKLFVEGLREVSRSKMQTAAAVLLKTNFTFDDPDFKVDLAYALSTYINALNEEYQDLTDTYITIYGIAIPLPYVIIDPYEGIITPETPVVGDVYQIGWNVAVYSDFDSRNVEVQLYNDVLETSAYNMFDGDISIYNEFNEVDTSLWKDEFEVVQYEELFIK